MPALARAEQAEIRTARPRTAGRSRASSRLSWVSRHFTGARIDLNEFPDKDHLLSADPESRAWPSEAPPRSTLRFALRGAIRRDAGRLAVLRAGGRGEGPRRE